jgi:hypothetical protein
LAFKHRTDNIRVNGVLPACIHTGALDRMAVKKGIALPEYAALRAEAHPMLVSVLCAVCCVCVSMCVIVGGRERERERDRVYAGLSVIP